MKHHLKTAAALIAAGTLVISLMLGWFGPRLDAFEPLGQAADATALGPRSAPNMAQAIRMACHSTGDEGRVNSYGDIQCHRGGKPTYYVHVTRVRE